MSFHGTKARTTRVDVPGAIPAGSRVVYRIDGEPVSAAEVELIVETNSEWPHAKVSFGGQRTLWPVRVYRGDDIIALDHGILGRGDCDC